MMMTIGSRIFDGSFNERNLQLIGRGGFSWIYLAACNVTGQPIVVKKLKSQDKETLAFLAKEASYIMTLNSQASSPRHIIQVYSHFQMDEDIYIAMEYCPLGSLERLLQAKQQLPLEEITLLATQMIESLAFAHNLGLAHSDIKPENVLIRNEKEFVLTDWGSAQQFSHQHSTALRDSTCFTPGFQAPELQSENLLQSDNKLNYFIADIYSLGMTLLRCIGPQFREIRTISSEADKSDHDWKLDKLFKTYIQGKSYQNGVIDKIIVGFLQYEKQVRMRLEEAIVLLRSSYQPQSHKNNMNEFSSFSEELNIPITQSASFQGQLSFNEQEEDKIHFSQLKITSNETVFSIPSLLTINKLEAAQQRRLNRHQAAQEMNIDSQESSSPVLKKSGSEVDSGLSTDGSEKQKMREMKRNRSNEAKQNRINKNLSISYLSELIKINKEIDHFKAYFQSQVGDEEIKLMCNRIVEMSQLRKLFLILSRTNECSLSISDFACKELESALIKFPKLTELQLDISNQSRVSMSSINSLLETIANNCSIDTLSLSIARVQIGGEDFDDFVDKVFDIQNLKNLSISLSQTSVSEDDVFFLCNEASAHELLENFKLVCPKQISQATADQIQSNLQEAIPDARVTVN